MLKNLKSKFLVSFFSCPHLIFYVLHYQVIEQDVCCYTGYSPADIQFYYWLFTQIKILVRDYVQAFHTQI